MPSANQSWPLKLADNHLTSNSPTIIPVFILHVELVTQCQFWDERGKNSSDCTCCPLCSKQKELSFDVCCTDFVVLKQSQIYISHGKGAPLICHDVAVDTSEALKIIQVNLTWAAIFFKRTLNKPYQNIFQYSLPDLGSHVTMLGSRVFPLPRGVAYDKFNFYKKIFLQ